MVAQRYKFTRNIAVAPLDTYCELHLLDACRGYSTTLANIESMQVFLSISIHPILTRGLSLLLVSLSAFAFGLGAEIDLATELRYRATLFFLLKPQGRLEGLP